MLESACRANQHGLKRDVINFITLSPGISSSVRDRKQFPGGKRPRPGGLGEREFADGQDWARLSRAQLRRACSERYTAGPGTVRNMGLLLTVLGPATCVEFTYSGPVQ